MLTGLVLIAIPPGQWLLAAVTQHRLEQQFLAAQSSGNWSIPSTADTHSWPVSSSGGAPAAGIGAGSDAGGQGAPADTIGGRWLERLRSFIWEDPSVVMPPELEDWAELNRPDEKFLENFPGALIHIPSIDVRAIVLYGTSLRILAQGPGFYEVGVLPGQRGNVAIAGHRTTYGAWFRHVDKLKAGDEIELYFQGVKYRYAVERVWVIASNDWSVVAPTENSMLTLTACHPPGSAAYRIAVRARLIESVYPKARPSHMPMPL